MVGIGQMIKMIVVAVYSLDVRDKIYTIDF